MARNVATCDASATLMEVGQVMLDRDVGDVLVTDGDELLGIVTDRDIVVRCVAWGADPSETRISTACTEDLVTVSPDATLEEAARVMSDRAVRRLPVLEDGRPVGVISLADLAI